MARLLSTLILLLSLLSFSAALVPRTPTTTTGENVVKRQTNRKRILAREAMKRSSGIMEVVAEHNTGGNWGHHGGDWGNHHPHKPHHSGKTYPKCKVDCGYPGLARYKNWDLYGDDLPGNPVDIGKHGSEEKCLEQCYKHDWHHDWKTACVGVEYTPASKHGKCYLKGLQVSKGKFTNTSPGAQLDGTYLDLIGGCAAWAPYVPKEMDAVCCNSR